MVDDMMRLELKDYYLIEMPGEISILDQKPGNRTFDCHSAACFVKINPEAKPNGVKCYHEIVVGFLEADLSDAATEFFVDQRVRLALEWPFMLNGVIALTLAVSGPILEVNERDVRVKVVRYDFRTAGSNKSRTPVQIFKLTVAGE
jgi:hypothetical protein